MSRLRLLILLGLSALAGCGPSEPRPLVPVADPQAYVREQLVATATPSWSSSRSDYNLDDPAFLDSLIEVTVDHRRELDGALPGDEAALDRVVRDATGRYNVAMTASGARRAEVEARIRDRFASPPVEMRGTTAHADLGLVPSVFVPDRGSSWRLRAPDAEERGELASALVAKTFATMRAAAPQAERFQFEVVVPQGSSRGRIRYSYSEGADRLWVLMPGSFHVSPEPVGGLDALVAGGVPTHTFDLERTCGMEGDGPCPQIWVE